MYIVLITHCNVKIIECDLVCCSRYNDMVKGLVIQKAKEGVFFSITFKLCVESPASCSVSNEL